MPSVKLGEAEVNDRFQADQSRGPEQGTDPSRKMTPLCQVRSMSSRARPSAAAVAAMANRRGCSAKDAGPLRVDQSLWLRLRAQLDAAARFRQRPG